MNGEGLSDKQKITEESLCEQGVVQWYISENDHVHKVIGIIQNDIQNELDLVDLLVCACDYGRLDIVKYLTEEKDIDPAANDNMPIKMACKSLLFEVVDYLKSKGASLDEGIEKKYRSILQKRKDYEEKGNGNTPVESIYAQKD